MSDGVSRLQTALVYYERLRRVCKYVEQNYDEDISLEQAAGVACLERKYFSTYFREKTGVCFKDWLAEVRIARAKAIMVAQSCSLTEIASAVGFRNLRAFERAFKRCTGMTPREFKNAVRPG